MWKEKNVFFLQNNIWLLVGIVPSTEGRLAARYFTYRTQLGEKERTQGKLDRSQSLFSISYLMKYHSQAGSAGENDPPQK